MKTEGKNCLLIEFAQETELHRPFDVQLRILPFLVGTYNQ